MPPFFSVKNYFELIEYEEGLYFLHGKQSKDMTKEHAEQLLKFIIENEEKAENYDACGNLINQVNELLVENKQLKEELSRTVGDFINLKNINDNLKQKLEKIEEAYLNIHFTDDGEVFQNKIKKILRSSS